VQQPLPVNGFVNKELSRKVELQLKNGDFYVVRAEILQASHM
jgi:hypothetical protein